MICERCHGSGRQLHGGALTPCPACLGLGSVSCCDGPAGAGDELPTDPLSGPGAALTPVDTDSDPAGRKR